jgi:co-chaperonin GroES (HSP10)
MLRRKEKLVMRKSFVAMREWTPPRGGSVLVLPEGVREDDLPRGEIVALGADIIDDPKVGLKVGDVVFITGIAGASPMEVNGERLIVVHEREVTGIVEQLGYEDDNPLVSSN